MDKDTKKLVKAAEAQGFTVTRTKNGHPRISKDGQWVTVLPGTTSDWRSRRNALAALRRAGFQGPAQG